MRDPDYSVDDNESSDGSSNGSSNGSKYDESIDIIGEENESIKKDISKCIPDLMNQFTNTDIKSFVKCCNKYITKLHDKPNLLKVILVLFTIYPIYTYERNLLCNILNSKEFWIHIKRDVDEEWTTFAIHIYNNYDESSITPLNNHIIPPKIDIPEVCPYDDLKKMLLDYYNNILIPIQNNISIPIHNNISIQTSKHLGNYNSGGLSEIDMNMVKQSIIQTGKWGLTSVSTNHIGVIGGILIAISIIISSVLLSRISEKKPKECNVTPPPTNVNVIVKSNITMINKLIADNLTLIEIYNKKYDNMKVNNRKAYYESLNATHIQIWAPRLLILYIVCYIILVCIYIYKVSDTLVNKIMALVSFYVITNVYVLKFIILFIIYIYNIISVRYLYNIIK